MRSALAAKHILSKDLLFFLQNHCIASVYALLYVCIPLVPLSSTRNSRLHYTTLVQLGSATCLAHTHVSQIQDTPAINS